MTEQNLGIWKYRLGAFLIDLLFITILTAIVRNINPIPIPDWLEYLTPLITFYFYFLVLSSIKKRDFSFGKAVLKLRVKYDEDTKVFSYKKFNIRILILALIWPIELQELPSRLLGFDFYGGIGILLFAFQYSVIIYSAYLAIKTEKMIHDRATNTSIEFAPSNTDQVFSTDLQLNYSIHKPSELIILFLIISSLSFTMNHIFDDYSLFDSKDKSELEESIESGIYSGLTTRTNVEIWDSYEASKDFVNNTSKAEIVFNVDIWLPMIQWERNKAESIIRQTESNLNIDGDYYDRYHLKIRSAFVEMSISNEI
ncbi:MAG: RDD family protein [bacterium]|nr:RDD family protein [bacterium]